MNRYDCSFDVEDECAYMKPSADGAYISYEDFVEVLDTMWRTDVISRDVRNYAVSRFKCSGNQPVANKEEKA